MTFTHQYSEGIDLYVRGRISAEDAKRQSNTACEILKRLEKQPGLILADEVGMGKTFVALAVAASVVLSDKRKRPVVVMVPPSLKEKWPRDFELFREKCLPHDVGVNFQYDKAENAMEFLKLLDSSLETKKSIIFLTHGAMSKGLNAPLTKLALIYRALYHRKNVDKLRLALCRNMGRLLRRSWVDDKCPEIWNTLLTTDPSEWSEILDQYNINVDYDSQRNYSDPVPKAIQKAIWKLDADDLYEALCDIPYRESKYFENYLEDAHKEIDAELKKLWSECLKNLHLDLPLLILDEAHHLKNPQTRLASLFQDPNAKADAEEISRGLLEGIFERMLFLTATPFQLGHYELCSVLKKFNGISWKNKNSPPSGKEIFPKQIQELQEKLDAAQEASVRLDNAWGLLHRDDLVIDCKTYSNIETWWMDAQKNNSLRQAAQEAINRFKQANEKMRIAEEALKPWIIRHIKPKKLPEPHSGEPRRLNLVGKAIITEDTENLEMPGIDIEGNALLPFLIAARIVADSPNTRPIFAEGLASSYEAFLYTRKMREKNWKSNERNSLTDTDDEPADTYEIDNVDIWYLNQLQEALPLDNGDAMALHPKVEATVNRAIELWRRGEKVLIFCHYIATGRTLRQHISNFISREIIDIGASKLGCPKNKVFEELDRIGKRFFDIDSPLRRACDEEIESILKEYKLEKHRESLISIIRRYIRTPSFLIRYFSLEDKKYNRDSILQAMNNTDGSGLSLRTMLYDFFYFLVERCGEEELTDYLNALDKIQTGSHSGKDVIDAFSEDELQGDRSEHLAPNVRLVNGQTKQDSRQRLMLTFNTPFYPEVLIASSVMAEGVDLHLSCRHVIHHDLCWNPSTLEQRTGRIDRIGAKGERCGQAIRVYIPYVAETQDEKMYRVVMDRERWFKVIMGEKFKMDSHTTEKLAERIPFPNAAAETLAFKLEVSDAK